MEQLRWRSQVALVGTIWQERAGERREDAVILHVVHMGLRPEGVVSQGARCNALASHSGVGWWSSLKPSLCMRHFVCDVVELFMYSRSIQTYTNLSFLY